MPCKNRLNRAVSLIQRLPEPLHRPLLSKLFGSQVRLAGTAGVQVHSLSKQRALLSLRNRRKVANHIGGIHAAGMALLAESATGFLVAMNVPDDRLLLIKTLKVDYNQRVQGHLRAEAWLSPGQIAQIEQEPRGELWVPVTVTDQSGQTPIQCAMLWAWVTRKRA